MRHDLHDLIDGATTLASPPYVYQRLMDVIRHPRSSAVDMAQVIADDPGLSARVLRIVNSAFFSFPQRIETVTKAVTILGTAQLRDLAIATSVLTLFRDIPDDLVEMDSFWTHSLACGVASRAIAIRRGEANVERFFLAGLLHDIGRLVLYVQLPDESRRILERARSRCTPVFREETERLGFDHARLGGVLLDRWNLPAGYQEAVDMHHEPGASRRFPLETATVHVADVMANAVGWGSSGETRVPSFSPEAWALLELDPGELSGLLEDIERQSEAMIRIVQGSADA